MEKRGGIEPLKILADDPTQIDEIGYVSALTSTLVSILTSEIPRPFVVGLFGSWGSGKSSVVEMLSARPELPFKTVVIDAWRTDKENFLRQCVKKMARELLDKSESEQVTSALDSRISEQDSRWQPGAHAVLAVLGYTSCIQYVLGCDRSIDSAVSAAYFWIRM